MDRDASPSVPKTWCPRGQGARFRCPSQAGFGQVWCFVRVRRSDAIGVSRRRRRNAGACVRGCRIGFRRVADASNRGLRAACCRCRFGQLAGGGKWALSLNISPQSMPQQAAGITAAASCQQSTVGVMSFGNPHSSMAPRRVTTRHRTILLGRKSGKALNFLGLRWDSRSLGFEVPSHEIHRPPVFQAILPTHPAMPVVRRRIDLARCNRCHDRH